MRFVQWNDQHVSVEPSAYRLANEKQEYLVRATNELRPDFVISIGDMANAPGDLELFRELVCKLECPLYPVAGNHETVQTEGDPERQKPYNDVFGPRRWNYTFEAGGIVFVALDNSGAPASNSTGCGKLRNDWLRAMLESAADRPVIVCCHIPIVPVREASVLAESFGFASDYAHDGALLDIVSAHADSVIAVLSGHIHLTGAVEIGGVHHIVTSGSASYPADYSVFDVFDDHIHVQTITLPDHLQTPDTDIHGRPRWKTDYTDAQHPTHELYIKGNAWEREFDVWPIA